MIYSLRKVIWTVPESRSIAIASRSAHLLEVHNGGLPPWLSPTQVLVLPAGEDARGYASQVNDQLVRAGLRSELDDRDATLGSRIRSAQPRKIPWVAVVGRREQQAETVSVRLRTGRQLGTLAIGLFIETARDVVQRHATEGSD